MDATKIIAEADKLIEQINSIKFLHCVTSNIKHEMDESKYEEVLYDYYNNHLTLSCLYNIFYTKACALLEVILPDRLEEFKACYIYDNKARTHIPQHRTISAFFNGGENIRQPFENSLADHVLSLFLQQENILISAKEFVDNVLYGLENKIQYNFFMDELSASEELLKNKYIRPAGMVAGVALESHLKSVCKNRGIKIKAKDTLGNFIGYLRNNNIIDFREERKLLTLADTRNLCCHQRDREPTKDEIIDLIAGTKKALAEIN